MKSSAYPVSRIFSAVRIGTNSINPASTQMDQPVNAKRVLEIIKLSVDCKLLPRVVADVGGIVYMR